MPQPPSPPFRLAPDALLQRLGEETALVQLEQDRYYTLDDVGTQMLEALLAAQDVEQAVDRLAAIYDADRATLHADLVRIADELVAAGLLTAG